MKLTVKNTQGQDQGELETTLMLIDTGKGTQAVHDAVVAYQAAQRSGTANTKTMGDVAGSGKKPWRQKGTGRARAGSFASPLWRGGGVVFGPKPRDFRKRISRSTKQLALRKALSSRLHAGEVLVVDEIKLQSHKTRDFLGILKALHIEGSTVIVVDALDQNLGRASRNLGRIKLTTSDTLNAYEALLGKKLLFTRSAFEKVEQRLK